MAEDCVMYKLCCARQDLEHHILVSLVSYCKDQQAQHAEPAVLRLILQEILRYATEHFAHEDQFMQDIGYAPAKAHKQQHAALLDELANALDIRGTQVPQPDWNAWLTAWLLKHLMEEDGDLRRYMKQKEFSMEIKAPLSILKS